jgi:hypothetical protein
LAEVDVNLSRPTSAMNWSVATEEEDEEDRARREEYERNKEEHGVDPSNYYELLGIGHLGMLATEKQIKKAYQVRV